MTQPPYGQDQPDQSTPAPDAGQQWPPAQDPSAPASADPSSWNPPAAAPADPYAQQQPSADPYGQSQPSGGGYGQPSADPYGQSQPAAGGYSQASADPYGQQQADPAQGGYGQPSADPYGQQAAYGQQQGGYGQPYAQEVPPAQPYGQGPVADPYGQAAYAGAQGNWQVQPMGALDPKQPHAYVPGTPPPVAGQAPVSASDEKLWAILSHVGMIVTGFIGPLIIWAVFKDRSSWIKAHATEALNFGILCAIGYIIASILTVIIIGAILLPAIGILALIFGILGAVAANKGEYKPYPFNIRMIK